MSNVRIALSKRRKGERRYVVLRCDAVYGEQLRSAIRNHILRGTVRPVAKYVGSDVLYKFHIDYLDRVCMTFPDADMSYGLQRRLSRAFAKQIEEMPVPDIEVPGFNGELYDFQKQGVGEAIEHLSTTGVFMLNDEMGLGKTIQAMAAAIKLKRKSILVVTTKSGCDAWARIIRLLFPRVKYEIIEGDAAARARKARHKCRVRLVNFEALRVQAFTQDGRVWEKNMRQSKNNRKVFKPINPDLFRQHYDMLVIDEFHKVKNPEAQRTQGFLQLPRAEHELLMSGTPFLNNQLELWPSLNRLWPSKYPDYPVFEANLAIKDGGTIVGYNPDAMIELRNWLAAHSLRRRKDQVGIQMPKVVQVTVEVELTAEQRRLYKRIEKEMRMELEDGTIKSIMGALPKIIRLKQACFSPELYGGSRHSAKIEHLKEIVRELVASGEKAIIFTQWEKAALILKREFEEYNPAYVTGKVTGNAKVNGVRVSKRSLQEDKFNTDDTCKLYIGTIKANQEAITLSAGTYVIFTDKEWSPNANDQAAARSAAGGLRGINATGPVHVIDLFAKDTFELRIEQMLAYKKGLHDRVVERDGGRDGKRRRIDAGRLTMGDIRRALSGDLTDEEAAAA